MAYRILEEGPGQKIGLLVVHNTRLETTGAGVSLKLNNSHVDGEEVSHRRRCELMQC